MIKKAVIVAAGKSSRLYPRTLEQPKSLLPIILEPFEQSLIEKSIMHLRESGIDEIGVVVGYRHDMIKNLLKDQVTYIINPFYEHCNNLGSLWMARQFIGEDPFVYLHSDIVYEKEILLHVLSEINSRKQTDIELAVDFSAFDEESMKVRVDDQNFLIESNKEIPLQTAHGEWIGLAVFKNHQRFFEQATKDLLSPQSQYLNMYDTFSLTNICRETKIHCTSTKNSKWVEVDFEADYQKALKLFNPSKR